MRQLGDELARQGHKVFVVSGTNEQGITDKDGLCFIKLPLTSKNPLSCLKNLIVLHRIIKDNRINVVHCHHRVAALYMKFYRMLWKIPVVYTLHLAPIPHDIIHRIFTYAGDMAIGVSTEVANFLRIGLKVPGDRIQVVLNGVEVRNQLNISGINKGGLRKKFSIPEDKFVLLLNSRIAHVKNHLIMVEAIHELQNDVKDKIVVVCTGEQTGDYYNLVVEKILEYGLQKQFHFVGWVNPYEISAVSDFLFLPSFQEGFALNIAEAFFMKLPSARTATCGWEDLKIGCLQIYPDRTDEIKQIITTLLDKGKSAFTEQVERAYKFALENLTVEVMVRNTVKVYNQAIDICYAKQKCKRRPE